MGLFSSPRRKNTKGNQIRKLKGKIAKKSKKLAQQRELEQLRAKWNKMR